MRAIANAEEKDEKEIPEGAEPPYLPKVCL